MSQHRQQSALTAQLDREWRRLARRRIDPSTIRAWRSGDVILDRWAHQHLIAVECLDQLVDACHRRHSRIADDVLHWLLRVGAEEPVAHRIVVQRTIPLVVAGARRQRGAEISTAPIDDAITSLTVAVANADFPLEARHVAPRLASRAFHDAFRKPHRCRHQTTELPCPAMRFDERAAVGETPDPLVITARLLDIARSAGVHPERVELARRLACGASTADIAAEQHCTDRTIRNRRAKLVDDLRAVARQRGIDRYDADSLVGPRASRTSAVSRTAA